MGSNQGFFTRPRNVFFCIDFLIDSVSNSHVIFEGLADLRDRK